MPYCCKILSRQTNVKIKHLYHISDIHIRNQNRHDEYRQVFENLYVRLREVSHYKGEKTNSGLIVITGDIVHSKSQISPQLIIELRDFFTNLCQIMPVLFIAGNHDLTLNNKTIPDTLSSIMHRMDIPNLHYLKESGFYVWNNIVFTVMSVIDYPLIKASEMGEEFAGLTKIVLLHATLYGSRISCSSRPMEGDKYKVADFNGYDYVLLGDIHLHQYLNSAKTIAYAGSLVQQNFGETLYGHGYLDWNLEDGTSKLVEIENNYCYTNFIYKRNKMILTNDE